MLEQFFGMRIDEDDEIGHRVLWRSVIGRDAEKSAETKRGGGEDVKRVWHCLDN